VTISEWTSAGIPLRLWLAQMANGRQKFNRQTAGGPYTIKITGKQSVELHDVLVGDVWICAGQSNMQFGLSQARNAADEIKNANFPQIRFFVVGQKAAYSRVDVPHGSWKVVSPFFAARIHVAAAESASSHLCRSGHWRRPIFDCEAAAINSHSSGLRLQGRMPDSDLFLKRASNGRSSRYQRWALQNRFWPNRSL
jgi:hypothetical protein